MADNPTLSKIILPSGQEYDIKDAKARSDIADIQSAIAGGLHFLGTTTTALTDQATTNPIVINGNNVTAKAGDLVLYGQKEFLFDGTKWLEMGDLSLLGALAYKSSASGSYTPAGTISQPTFTGTEAAVAVSATANENGNYQPAGTVSQPTFSGSAMSSTGKFTPSGTVSQPTFSGSSMSSTGKFTPSGSVSVSTATTENKTATVSAADSGAATYTPAGTVAAPTISVASAGTTDTVYSITDVGTLPELTTTVANETLTIGFSQGTLPTKGSGQTVKTGDASYEASAPAFTGTGARLVTGNIAVPATFSGSFTGSEDDVTVSGTPAGTVSQPTFSGSEDDVTVSGTPTGTVSQPTFSGTKVQLAGTTTAAGTVSQPTFTGTADTITVS